MREAETNKAGLEQALNTARQEAAEAREESQAAQGRLSERLAVLRQDMQAQEEQARREADAAAAEQARLEDVVRGLKQELVDALRQVNQKQGQKGEERRVRRTRVRKR